MTLSSPDHIAAVSSTGLVTGVKAGTATISGKVKGIKGSATLVQ